MNFIREVIEAALDIQRDVVTGLGEEFPAVYAFVFFLAY